MENRSMIDRLCCVGLCCLFALAALADDAQDPFTRDVLIVSDWFEGDFDNEEQLWFHARSRAEGEAPTRIHTSNKRVDLPAFGDHVFYVEEYVDNDPAQVVRQRLVIFSSDLEANAIRMRQGFFKNAKSVAGARQDSSKIAELTTDDVFFMDECDVFLRRIADQFHGGMKSKSCVFGDGKERRYSVHDVVLSESKFWRTDATFLVSDDSFYKGTPLDEPTQLRRAKIFLCDFYFYGEDGTQQVVEDLRIHSQGGTGTAVRESDGQSFDLLLREKEYPYYESRPDFMYYSLRHTGASRSVAYGVADPDSRQFGANIGSIAAFCHRDGYEFRENLAEL